MRELIEAMVARTVAIALVVVGALLAVAVAVGFAIGRIWN